MTGVWSTYEDRIVQVLSNAAHASSLTAFLRGAAGAPPPLALQMAAAMDLRVPKSTHSSEPYPCFPELHPLLYEWYFTPEAATFVGEVARGSGRSWTMLGVPSVASEMSKVDQGVRLIDANPGVIDRFAGLNERASVTIAEVGAAPVNERSDVVVIDPPWYPADVMRWLSIGLRHVKPGGTIATTLFPPLTRPTADAERAAIFAAASRIGRLDIYPAKLTYSTPLFEREAFRAEGVPDPGDWRAADLLVVRSVDTSVSLPRSSGAHLGVKGWARYVLGSQVVMLAVRSEENATLGADWVPALAPIEGCPGNVLPSVSERDPRRKRIGLWTSRNRVAAVVDPVRVAAWLEVAQAEGPAGLKRVVPADQISLVRDLLTL